MKRNLTEGQAITPIIVRSSNLITIGRDFRGRQQIFSIINTKLVPPVVHGRSPPKFDKYPEEDLRRNLGALSEDRKVEANHLNEDLAEDGAIEVNLIVNQMYEEDSADVNPTVEHISQSTLLIMYPKLHLIITN